MRYMWIGIVAVVIGAFSVGAYAVVQEPPSEGLFRGRILEAPEEFRFLFQSAPFLNSSFEDRWRNLPCESIALERQPGFSLRDPKYKVTLHRGTADRIAQVELRVESGLTPGFPKSGEYSGQIDIIAYGRLCYLLDKTPFSAFRDSYVRGGDQPSRTVTVNLRGKTKAVSEYGPSGPIELWGIQEAIDSAAKSITWTPK